MQKAILKQFKYFSVKFASINMGCLRRNMERYLAFIYFSLFVIGSTSGILVLRHRGQEFYH